MIAYLRSLANRLLKSKQAEFENSSLQDLAKLEYVTQVGPAHQRIHNSWDPGIDITDHFFKMLVNFNPNLPTIPVEHEMAILDGLRLATQSVVSNAEMVPRVPSVIPQLLKSLRDENISIQELAVLIIRDMSIVAELVKQANSAQYNQSAPVTSIENAIAVLGKNNVRILATKIAFKPLFNIKSGRYSRVATPVLWDQSEKCALAALLLFPRSNDLAFPLFLAALVQNVGYMVMFRLYDQHFPNIPCPVSPQFLFGFTKIARELSLSIAKEWELPDEVSLGLNELMHVEENAPRMQLGYLLYMCMQLSKLRILINTRQVDEKTAINDDIPPSFARCLRAINVNSDPP